MELTKKQSFWKAHIEAAQGFWSRRSKTQIPTSTCLGKAVQYTQSQWPRLISYLDDGRLLIDNNGVENAIRSFALGRKNWLFSDSQGGVKASANLYSLIETAKANGLNDHAYLKWVFAERLQRIELQLGVVGIEIEFQTGRNSSLHLLEARASTVR